jgi:hypothetical protein
MSPHCDDEVKYGVVDDVVKEYQDLFAAGGSILGRKITEVITVNGVRVHLEDGSWVLVRASSNKPGDGGGGREHQLRRRHARPVPPGSEAAPGEDLGSGKYNQEI